MKKFLQVFLVGVISLIILSCSSSVDTEELDDLISQIDDKKITKESFYGKWSLVECEWYEIAENGQKTTYHFTEAEGIIIFEFTPSEIVSYEDKIMSDTKIINWKYDADRKLIIGTFSEYYDNEWITYGVDDADYIIVHEINKTTMFLEEISMDNRYRCKRTFKKFNI